jgi:WhiB family redox-sensing transcriptional regulator
LKNINPKPREPWKYENPICAQVGTEIFFSEDYDDVDRLNVFNYNQAKKVCASCDHIVECADWGTLHEAYGVWGGLDPKDRADIRRSANVILNRRV